eukprot:TRINITY_DN3159_c0_g1_i1.p1 TRINITY_DN3159_c0_g1~~TRINITY_DN3159_c0_g1_i1.p1  ORF type:complete len:130 (-),score=45.24 TRINITY_DN3159_c0_g1_i1:295-684(-)
MDYSLQEEALFEEDEYLDEEEEEPELSIRVGTFVWAKIPGLPWWPARVVLPQSAPEYVNRFRADDRTLVYFYGTRDHAWLQEEKLRVFYDQNEKFAVERPMKVHKKYFEQGMRELVRAMARESKDLNQT